MSTQSNAYPSAIADYVQAISLTREPAVMARLRERTSGMPMAVMQISAEQGLLLGLLVRMLAARRTIEVGVFTGYSALAVARMLPPDGRVVACDVSEEWTAIAREYWAEAGMADRIDLRLGPAASTLDAMIAAGEAGSYDFAFIDADKSGYPGYFAQCLELVRPGGLIALDNAFLDGQVLDPDATQASGRVLRDLTQQIFADQRVEPALVPIGDGLLLARRRE
ncbi:MAG TPA: class I SAM-dependent methyltransferase [Steroidobacteraceae bacterium]|nr:class I SAM-dependent methyltransferase [Steroidobacteraceae bacterium]